MRHLFAVTLLSLGLAACSGGSSGASLGSEPSNALPPIKVDLPPQPAFLPPDVPIKTAEGVYSIYGVRKEKATTLTKDVKVKGYLLEVYVCPVCPKGQTCKACDQPHFFIGDKPDTKKEKALMVVDYLAPKQKPPMLTVGKQYEIAGSFNINSPTGFGSSDGLLVFNNMTDDKNVVFQSPTAKLEEKAQAGEAIEAAFAKKREAAKKK
ncbi:MAG: hypothetical protein ABI321_12395 [Polyangia bacterium]